MSVPKLKFCSDLGGHSHSKKFLSCHRKFVYKKSIGIFLIVLI